MEQNHGLIIGVGEMWDEGKADLDLSVTFR